MNKIMLVDDDNPTNFYNRYILKKHHVKGEIIVMDNGVKALEYIKNVAIPDIIFLDINMPIMGGIEFLEEAHKWANGKLDGVKIFVMMGVDISEETLKRLQGIRKIEIIKSKVLTNKDIGKIFKEFKMDDK